MFALRLAGLPMPRDAVLELVPLLEAGDEHSARNLRRTVEREARIIALVEPPESGSVSTMRIAGVRLGAPVARTLSEILESEGYPATARKIADAIKLQVTVEAPLTGADYEAIAEALSRNCPAPLYRLRTELLEQQRRLRRITGG